MDSFRLRFVSCPGNFPDARITPEEGDIVKFERRRVDNKPIEFEGGGGIALMQNGLFSGWVRKDEKELVTDDMFRLRWKVTSIYHIWDFEEGGGESRLGYVGIVKGEEGSLHDSVIKEEKIENVDEAHSNAIKEEQAENLIGEHPQHEINEDLGVDEGAEGEWVKFEGPQDENDDGVQDVIVNEEGIADGEESLGSVVEGAHNDGGQSENHEQDSGAENIIIKAEGIEDFEDATLTAEAAGDERGGYVNKRDRGESESDGEGSFEGEPFQIKEEPEEEKSPQKRRRVMEAFEKINICGDCMRHIMASTSNISRRSQETR